MDIRDRVISAFRPEEGYTYSHRLPFRYSNFIDGMAWVGMLCGAARIAQDWELIELTEGYLINLLLVGPDARNFGPTAKTSPEWERSAHMPGYSYKVKPQSFAGPAALRWAVSKGARVDLSLVPDVTRTARALCLVSPLFGLLVKHIKSLRQHVNSVMFAHLLTDSNTPSTMKFLEIKNPVYQYIGSGAVVDTDFVYPNTGPWPAKDWPDSPSVPEGDYTPLCSLVGQLLS